MYTLLYTEWKEILYLCMATHCLGKLQTLEATEIPTRASHVRKFSRKAITNSIASRRGRGAEKELVGRFVGSRGSFQQDEIRKGLRLENPLEDSHRFPSLPFPSQPTGSSKTLGTILCDPIVPSSVGQVGLSGYSAIFSSQSAR